jgi:hypothetical protein
MRQLTAHELEMVTGSGIVCPPPTVPGNPGNYKPVGNAGETPPEFSLTLQVVFVLNGGDTLNGRTGASPVNPNK